MLSTRPIAVNADADAATQPVLNTKTPGRKGFKNRAALQENAIHSGAKTVLSKKNVLHTPFRPGTAHGKKPLVSVSVTRPLMDKTPFPNRVAPGGLGTSKTPGMKGTKLSKLSLLVPEPEQPELLSPDVAPLLRPSSTRKSLRGRLSGTFKTPVTKGDHWNVSPGDMGMGVGMELAGGPAVQATEESVPVEDEDDEIEYMPPTAIERPYEPPFDLPDYSSIGKTVFALGHAPLLDDTLDVYYGADIETQLDVKEIVAAAGSELRVDDLEREELEDDSPFPAKPKAPPPPAVNKAPAGRTVSSSTRPIPSRTVTTAPTSPPQAQPRPATAIPQSRPASRTTPSSGSAPAPGPAPTRTSVLRAAKAAAASNSATTPHPTRPTPAASAGARPASTAPPRRPATSAATTRPVARSVSATVAAPTVKASTSAAAAGVRARPAAAGPAVAGRPRSATVAAPLTKAKAAPKKAPAFDDPLAEKLEKEVGECWDDDFVFDV
ncbi:hypothetical protein OH77DRAFT_1424747 [Trametes cingulata]|nr:hypothetical protein OH77DRAFT_1424747 [Trametes cingulata]